MAIDDRALQHVVHIVACPRREIPPDDCVYRHLHDDDVERYGEQLRTVLADAARPPAGLVAAASRVAAAFPPLAHPATPRAVALEQLRAAVDGVDR